MPLLPEPDEEDAFVECGRAVLLRRPVFSSLDLRVRRGFWGCAATQPYRVWVSHSRVHSLAQLCGGEAERLRAPGQCHDVNGEQFRVGAARCARRPNRLKAELQTGAVPGMESGCAPSGLPTNMSIPSSDSVA